QKPLADRELFQMAETKPRGQALLRQLHQRRQGTNMDRRVHLSAGADRNQAPSFAGVAPDFYASHRDQYIRENIAGSVSCEFGAKRARAARKQPVDSSMKSTGQ